MARPRSLRYLPTATDAGDRPDRRRRHVPGRAPGLDPAARGRRPAAVRYRLDLRFAAAAGSLVVEGPGLDGVPDRAAVLVRRARERIRRAVIPTEVSQVGAVEAP